MAEIASVKMTTFGEVAGLGNSSDICCASVRSFYQQINVPILPGWVLIPHFRMHAALKIFKSREAASVVHGLCI